MTLIDELGWHVHSPRGELVAACVYVLDAIILAMSHGTGTGIMRGDVLWWKAPAGTMLDMAKAAAIAEELRARYYGKS
jgi:hypothetical protein